MGKARQAPAGLCKVEKACLSLRRGARPASLGALPPRPPLLQVHKFINRNRGHLDAAMLEVLRQSQLQVTWLSFQALSELCGASP